MYLCARGNNCSSFYDFKLDIGIVPTKCCCFFIVFHVVCPPNSVAISWRSALIRDVVIISSSYFSTQVWYLISLIVIHMREWVIRIRNSTKNRQHLSIPTCCTTQHISAVPWCVGIERLHCTYIERQYRKKHTLLLLVVEHMQKSKIIK
jgi:hypothetical protein